jgi:hypothetical protein
MRLDLGWSEKELRAENRMFFDWDRLCGFARNAKRIGVTSEA